MGDKINTTVKAATRPVVTGVVEETVEDVLAVVLVEQNDGIKTWIGNMVENALIDIVKQGRLGNVLVPMWIGWLNPIVLHTLSRK